MFEKLELLVRAYEDRSTKVWKELRKLEKKGLVDINDWSNAKLNEKKELQKVISEMMELKTDLVFRSFSTPTDLVKRKEN